MCSFFRRPTHHQESMGANLGALFDLRFARVCTAMHERDFRILSVCWSCCNPLLTAFSTLLDLLFMLQFYEVDTAHDTSNSQACLEHRHRWFGAPHSKPLTQSHGMRLLHGHYLMMDTEHPNDELPHLHS
jgi:hypothetical protein